MRNSLFLVLALTVCVAGHAAKKKAGKKEATSSAASSPATSKQAYQLKVIPIKTSEKFTLEGVELVPGKKGIEKWLLSGKCENGIGMEIKAGVRALCNEEKWSIELPHQPQNDLLNIQLYEAKDSTGPAAKDDLKLLEKVRYILSWNPTTETANVTHEVLQLNNVSQAYLEDQPIDFIDLDSPDRNKIRIKNYSPRMLDADKAELFISSGLETYEVNKVLEKDEYGSVPWELWGPQILKPGHYEYRVTLWSNQLDYLGVLNQIEVGRYSEETWQLKTFGIGFLYGYQPSSSGSVFSSDIRWAPRYQKRQWGVGPELGLLILKDSTGGVFTAIEVLAGAGYRVGMVEIQGGIGWQIWFVAANPSGIVYSGGTLLQLGEKTSRFMLGCRAVQLRYSYLNMNSPVHLFRSAFMWTL